MSEPENVGPVDPKNRTSEILGEGGENSRTEKGQGCYWDGKLFGEGAEVCATGRRLRCGNGSWFFVGQC